MSCTLVILPWGQSKVWDDDPQRGPVPTREAYTGPPFKVNRGYGERQGDRSVILSEPACQVGVHRALGARCLV